MPAAKNRTDTTFSLNQMPAAKNRTNTTFYFVQEQLDHQLLEPIDFELQLTAAPIGIDLLGGVFLSPPIVRDVQMRLAISNQDIDAAYRAGGRHQ
jgi:hypothetical protein